MKFRIVAMLVIAAVTAVIAAVGPRGVIPPERQPALDKALADVAAAVSNQFRAQTPRSFDWSHADAPDRGSNQVARAEWMALGINDLPCRARVDEYKGPAGAGWVLTLEATPNASRSNRFVAVIATGPESWRTTSWVEVAEARQP